jgi:hypothetical protein
MTLLEEWVIIHKYDENEIFQDNWMVWCRGNEMTIENERVRLLNSGYKKDIYEKMYKTVRYYLKNKSIVKKEPKKRRIYVSLDKDFLDEIDKHVNDNGLTLSPKESFKNFENGSEYIKYYDISVKNLKEYGLDEIEVYAKIKKTYKNRYFIFKKYRN